MSLMRRTRPEGDWLDWPGWSRRLFDVPESLFGTAEEGMLRVEEFKENGDLVIRAEMPGINPESDVEITVSDNMLRIKAERRQESKTEDKQGYRSEFRYGSFTRALTLPAGATEEDVKATYNDGILEVRVPVSEEKAAAKKVPIARG